MSEGGSPTGGSPTGGSPAGLPAVHIIEEGMREGMQIESASIPADDKIRLLDALSATGLRTIVAGSFVSPRWVPQMAHIDEIISRFTPAPGVTYTALALNAKGGERRAAYEPKISPDSKAADGFGGASARTIIHLCDVFVQRNTARSQADEVAAIPRMVSSAVERGERFATASINAAWGSNWLGRFDLDQRLAALETQISAWTAAGIEVNRVWLGDPMSWNTPRAVEETLRAIIDRWPSVTTFHLHLHDGRGTALLSAYQALRLLGQEHTLVLDSSIGGMGGCPYCGNGRATRMIPTEDLVHLLESEGIDTGIDLDRLIEAAAVAEEIVGHELYGRVSKAGPRPGSADRLYPMDMPFIETLEEAQHFRLGPDVYDGAPSPWKEPITSPARDAAERGEPIPMEFEVPPTAPETSGKGSLHGIRVVELSTSIAGPTAGQLLADLGAEVIKIERIGAGDDTRRWGPPFWNGVSTAFLGMNRGKKSLEIDYKDPRGAEILTELIASADVLVQNLRPGALAKAGFGWEQVRELNPRLVYCDMTGYGPDGPMKDAPAYDPLLQAYTGIVSLMPTTDSGPARVPLSILDKGTGNWAVIGILDALRRRDQTGRGSHIGVSLLNTALDWAAPSLMSTRAGSPPRGNLGSGHPGVVPYGAFPATDGWMFISAGNQALWLRLLDALGAPELDAREGFGANPERAARRAEVNAALSEVTGKFSRAELTERLEKAGVPHAPIQTMPEVLEDPQVAALDGIGQAPHPDVPGFEVVKLPVKIDGAQPPVAAAPPLLGADTTAVLAALGKTPEEIAGLLADGVAGQTGLKAGPTEGPK